MSSIHRSLTLFGENTRIFFWPTHLTLARTAGLSAGSLFPWPILALLGVGLAFAFRKREPELAFLIFWWPVTLAPCLDIRQLTFPFVADRFSYVPSVGLALAVLYCLRRILSSARFRLPVTAALILACAIQTSRTIPHWKNEDILSAYSIRESPSVPLFHALRGKVLATQSRDFEAATREYQTALMLAQSTQATVNVWRAAAHQAYMGLANIATLEGRFDEAARGYERAIEAMPANTLAYKQIAALSIQRGKLPQAAEYLSRVVKLDPQDLEARFNLGVCWLKLGNFGEAQEQFSAVASSDPDFPRIRDAEMQAGLHMR